MKKILLPSVLIFSQLFIFASGAVAQDTTRQKNDWTYLAEIYLMFPNMSGQTTVGNLPEVQVDADAADILGHLKGGGMFYLEANNNN